MLTSFRIINIETDMVINIVLYWLSLLLGPVFDNSLISFAETYEIWIRDVLFVNYWNE